MAIHKDIRFRRHMVNLEVYLNDFCIKPHVFKIKSDGDEYAKYYGYRGVEHNGTTNSTDPNA